jgi:cytochrome c
MKNLPRLRFLSLLAILAWSVTLPASGAGDPQRGARAFAQCMACHSTEPEHHMTGPSLADVWGRKAGGATGFLRYSDALKHSGITWNADTLDKWLAAPAQFIPGNQMAFGGIKDGETRRDLVAFLQAVSEGKAPPVGTQGEGMMGSWRMPNLKRAKASDQIKEIRHCRDTYFVTTMTGQVDKIWEFNLRFKTDSSDNGPRPGRPVILGAGMRGDRASIVFSAPNEISAFIRQGCP